MTESVDPRFQDLDAWSPERVATAIWETQLAAVAAVGPALPQIARAVEASAARLAGGAGRLVYVGAGTSARIAVQDGSELPPTFDWPEDRLRFLIAGGERALLHAVEGAEDDRDDAIRQARAASLGPDDVLIAVAASGRTPFTLTALAEARAAGALTIAVSNNPDAELLVGCEVPILVETGPEVVAGSTRMKAGTAQKVVLNMISTGIMIRLGRVHRGLMVDMRPLNDKLRQRAADMVARLADVSPEKAAGALAVADQDLKRAVLVAQGLSPDEAMQRLSVSGGSLRVALKEG